MESPRTNSDLELGIFQMQKEKCESDSIAGRWRKLHLSKAKLSGVTQMATLLAGFSVVAIVELDINESDCGILIAVFAFTTALLVGTTMISMMISTCILPHVEAIAELNECSAAHESPDDEMENYINISWFLANTVSIFLFAVDVVLLSWIKFGSNKDRIYASYATTGVMIPVLIIILAFGMVFYKKLFKHQFKVLEKRFHKLDTLERELERSYSVHEI